MGSDYGTEATPVVESNLQGSRGKLNVILHGLFAFDQGDKIVAYIPNMGSEHVYMAGTWLAETALAEHADLTLEGVTAGKKEDNNRLNRDHNIMVGDAPVTANGHECHCVHATLRFPYPPKKFEIRSLRRFIIPAKALGGADMKRIVRGRKEVQSATVQVLTYPFENDADLRLGDHPWEPVLEWDPAFKESFVNLHVFSEPERNSTDNHLRQAFQASIGLFVGVDLTLNAPAQPANLNDPSEKIPPGVHELEMEGLVQRKRWLAVLGRSIKETRDLNAFWEDPTAFDGSDPSTCPGCAGRP